MALVIAGVGVGASVLVLGAIAHAQSAQAKSPANQARMSPSAGYFVRASSWLVDDVPACGALVDGGDVWEAAIAAFVVHAVADEEVSRRVPADRIDVLPKRFRLTHKRAGERL